MVRTTSLAVFALALIPLAAPAATCTGESPAITAVSLRQVTQTPYLKLYHLSATVTNQGGHAQAGDVLQFVDIMQYGGRLDDRGIPPLAPGQSYTITYVWPRSADAGAMTSPLNFRMRSVAAESCPSSKSSAGITV